MCNHKWKVIATINYISSFSAYDDGVYGWMLQDKIYECQDCFVRRVVTRQCRISGIRKKYGYEPIRIPDWYNMIEGVYHNVYYGDFWTHKGVIHNRKLDYPNFPKLISELPLDGKTHIEQKIIEE